MNEQQLLLRKIARKRQEHVWSTGSPLKQIYTNIVCENCENSTNTAIVLSIGLGWRSGWVILCKDCNSNINYWGENEQQLETSFNRYKIEVSRS